MYFTEAAWMQTTKQKNSSGTNWQAQQEKQSELYEQAFGKLIGDYTYQKFEEAFERFGYTGIEEAIMDTGVLDSQIARTVEENFDNLRAQLQQQSEELIMATPFVEEEMLCGAMIDLALKRISLFEEP